MIGNVNGILLFQQIILFETKLRTNLCEKVFSDFLQIRCFDEAVAFFWAEIFDDCFYHTVPKHTILLFPKITNSDSICHFKFLRDSNMELSTFRIKSYSIWIFYKTIINRNEQSSSILPSRMRDLRLKTFKILYNWTTYLHTNVDFNAIWKILSSNL